MQVREALANAVERLCGADIEDAPRDARRLLAHAMGVPDDRVLLVLDESMTEQQLKVYRAAIESRAARQPVAQITGKRLFWGRSFQVTRDVLDPRPETETLIVAALEHPFGTVLDLGTGSGAIVLTLLAERAGANGLGVDLSPAALDVAHANARGLGLVPRARFAFSDWFGSVSGRFDLIVANPPYIGVNEIAQLAPDVRDWEPRMALVPAGCDGTGLAAYRHICAQAPRYLNPGGRLLVEIGATQGDAVAAIFARSELQAVKVLPDMTGRDRVVSGQVGAGQ